MRSATSTNSNTDYGNILNKKNATNYDSDFMSYKQPIKTNKQKSRSNSSDSDSTYKRTKKSTNNSNRKTRKEASESDNSRPSSVEKKSTRSARSMRSASADSPRKNNTANQANRASYSSRSRSRSPSQSTSRSQSPTLSRSISKTSPRTTSKSNKNNSTSPIRSGVISKKLMPKYDQASKRTFVAYGVRSKSNQNQLNRRHVAPNANKEALRQTAKKGTTRAPPVDAMTNMAGRVLSAQRIKNNDLRNKLNEMSMEMEKLKEENRTLKRVHQREEIALKRLENQENDVSRLVKNHIEEASALKNIIKTVKTDNRKLNGVLIDKDEEIRNLKKKYAELKKILNDKKLLDSAELSKKLEQSEQELASYKQKTETLERKVEMMEKNHKHEIGVEIAHHKETQKQVNKLNEEIKELKVKLEEKERSLDMLNIYARQTREGANSNWKSNSLQSLNNNANLDSPHDKRKNYDKKRREKKIMNTLIDEEKTQSARKNDEEFERQKEEARKMEEEMKEREAAERSRKEEEQKHAELLKLKQLKKKEEEEARKRDEEKQKEREREREKQKEKERQKEKEEKKARLDEEERKRREMAILEEEERKKRWISEKTLEEENKKQETAKKEELLAKLALISDDSKDSKVPSNQPVFDFSSTNISQPAQQKTFNGSNDYKFSSTIENLHEGKPSLSSRDSNKNELLSKLFGNTNASSNVAQKPKLNETPDNMFPHANGKNDSNANIKHSSKVTTNPWEIQDLNFNSTTSAATGNKSSNSSIKTDHYDFFSKLNATNVKKMEIDNSKLSKASINSNGQINRPKHDNRIILNNNGNSNNYTEDIEELVI